MTRILSDLAPILFRHRLTEMTVFVTAACNMTCDHCFVIDELNKKSSPLTVEELKKMAPHIPAMQRVHVSGGEPMIRQDLPEIAVTLSNDWNAGYVCVPTNGWYTKQTINLIEHFGQHGKGHLRLFFSISSPHAEDMDEFVHKKGAFVRWRETVKQAAEAAKKYPNITLLAVSVYTDHNQHFFPELVKFVLEETEVDEFSFHPARSHGTYRPTLDLVNYRKVLDEYFRSGYQGSPMMRAYRQMLREEHLKILAKEDEAVACNAGVLRVVVDPNGNVYPCEMRGFPNGDDRESWHMGNIRDADFDMPALLKSERARAVVDRVADEGCLCRHELDTGAALISQPKFQVRLLARAAKHAMRSYPDVRKKRPAAVA